VVNISSADKKLEIVYFRTKLETPSFIFVTRFGVKITKMVGLHIMELFEHNTCMVSISYSTGIGRTARHKCEINIVCQLMRGRNYTQFKILNSINFSYKKHYRLHIMKIETHAVWRMYSKLVVDRLNVQEHIL